MLFPRTLRRLAGATAALLVSLSLHSVMAPTAFGGVCAPATEEGRWENLNPGVGGVAHIEIVMNCQPLNVNGEAWPPGFAWTVRVFEKCGSGECEWGETGAVTRITRHITAIYGRGQAEKRVYLRMDPLTPHLLSTDVYEDFTNFEDANFGRHYWFRNPDPKPCTVTITNHDWEAHLYEWLDCDPEEGNRDTDDRHG